MSAGVDELALTASELKELTGYARSSKQMEVLAKLGVRAYLRPDNTVLVLRAHLRAPDAPAAVDRPKLNLKKK